MLKTTALTILLISPAAMFFIFCVHVAELSNYNFEAMIFVLVIDILSILYLWSLRKDKTKNNRENMRF